VIALAFPTYSLAKAARSDHAVVDDMADNSNRPERPRSEPEIIPPDRQGGQSDWRQPTFNRPGSGDARGTHRIYVTRLGPFGAALLLASVAILVVAFFITVLGAVLIWFPVVALLVAVAAIYRFFMRR
jgi:hypothetical protein